MLVVKLVDCVAGIFGLPIPEQQSLAGELPAYWFMHFLCPFNLPVIWVFLPRLEVISEARWSVSFTAKWPLGPCGLFKEGWLYYSGSTDFFCCQYCFCSPIASPIFFPIMVRLGKIDFVWTLPCAIAQSYKYTRVVWVDKIYDPILRLSIFCFNQGWFSGDFYYRSGR